MSYLTEAFRQLDLTEDMFSLDDDGMQDAVDMLNATDEKDDITVKDVIDMDAEDDEELKDNYIGQIILECPICHTFVYKNKDDIEIDEETETVNLEDSCPVCLSDGGFNIIGQVANFNYEEEPEDDVDVEVDGEDVDIEDSEDEVDVEDSENKENDGLEESFRRNHSLREACRSRKHKALTEKKWDYELETGRALRSAIDSCDGSQECLEDILALIQSCYQEAEDLTGEDFSDYIEELDYVEADEDEVDYALNDLYDFCDNMGIWIPLDDMNEAVDDKHLETKQGTIAQQLAKPEAQDRIQTLIGDTLQPWQNRRDKLISFISTLNSPESQKEKFINKLKNCKSENIFLGTVGAFMSGMPVSTHSRSKYYEDLDEGFNDVSITTDDEKLTMTQDPSSRKVTVTTEPVDSASDSFDDADFGDDEGFLDVDAEGETLAPLDSETEQELGLESDEESEDEEAFSEEESTEEESSEEETEGEETSEEDVEEVVEESLNRLTESYLKGVYDNVSSYKVTEITSPGPNKIMVEGIITFTSGNKKVTKFMFEASKKTRKGKLQFLGENLNITRGKKSFMLSGINNHGKFIAESLNYNYMVNGNQIKGKVK